jgi:hypothetical protein
VYYPFYTNYFMPANYTGHLRSISAIMYHAK